MAYLCTSRAQYTKLHGMMVADITWNAGPSLSDKDDIARKCWSLIGYGLKHTKTTNLEGRKQKCFISIYKFRIG